MTDDDVTARLAEALAAEEARPQREADPHAIIETQNWTRYAATLLPVVRELMAEAEAEALVAVAREALAKTPGWDPVLVPVGEIYARAAALRADRG